VSPECHQSVMYRERERDAVAVSTLHATPRLCRQGSTTSCFRQQGGVLLFSYIMLFQACAHSTSQRTVHAVLPCPRALLLLLLPLHNNRELFRLPEDVSPPYHPFVSASCL
jgi:hypothetical protein